MARKGWRPTGAGVPAEPAPASPTAQEPEPSALTPRRRAARRKAADDAAHPRLTAARQARPRQTTDHRPPAGKRTKEDDAIERIQLGNRWSKIVRAVKAGEYTWQEFTDGLTEEELARAQLKADNGTFMGRPPSFVPREFVLACQREQKRRFEEIFGSEVLGIAQSYVELCKDSDIPPKDRAKMMQYAMERIFGGIPKDIRLSQEQPWEQMVVNVVSEGQDEMAEHARRRYAGYAERLGEGQE
jgi:hypothetical protein